MDFPHYDLTVDSQASMDKNLLTDILGLVKPMWDIEKVALEDLSRSPSVKLNIICRHDDEAVFVRVNNDNNAHNEEHRRSRKFASAQNLSARLLCTFNNGLVEECLEGEPITWQTKHRVHDDKIKREIAAEMARYHTREVLEEARNVGIQPTVPALRKQNLDYLWEDMEKCGKVGKSVLDSLPGKDVIMNEMNVLNAMLEEEGAEKAFCHFDTDPDNIFVLQNGRVIFTDYDKTCISYPAAEIGYYFLVVNYQFGQSLLETYPDEQYGRDFCREYLKEKRKISNDNSPVTNEELEFFQRQVQLGMLLALLLFISYAYTCLTNQFNTDIPTHETLADIQDLWPAYHGIKAEVIKANRFYKQ